MSGSLNPYNPAFSGLNFRSGQPQQPVPVTPKFGQFTFEEARHDVFAYVERTEKQAEATQVMYEQRPYWDYMRIRYNPEEAREFAEAEYDLGGVDVRGREFLEALVTPKTIEPLDVPDRDRLTPDDYAQAGISEGRLREWADEKNLAYPRVY